MLKEKLKLLIISTLILSTSFVAVINTNNRTKPEDLRENIKNSIKSVTDSIAISHSVLIGNKCLSTPKLTLAYYNSNNYAPAWIGKDSGLGLADTLASIIKYCYLDGLDTGFYQYSLIKTLLTDSVRGWIKCHRYEPIAELDILLTDVFITYAVNQYAGFIHSEDNNVEWKNHIEDITPADSLQKAITCKNVRNILSHFYCGHPAYTRLKKTLALYLDIKRRGGWLQLPEQTKLRKGDTGAIVSMLRDRLFITGDIKACIVKPGVQKYDEAMVAAVKKTELRYGLDTDGIAGKQLIKAMNVSVDERITQLALNMERWRWQQHFINQPFIMVNIAGFNMDVMDSNKTTLSMNIMVGKPYTRTPLFHAKMTYLVINPWWDVPPKIAKNEILPAIQKDTSYITKNHIKIFSDWTKNAREIPSDSIKWNLISVSAFDYKLRQLPGEWNALGRVKFMFPNQYDVYLHDTPRKDLFAREVRTFTHGCIRVEKPLELATYLLHDITRWTKDSIIEAIDSNVQQTVVLPKPIDVYVCYWTTWVDDDGLVYFRPDIYNYDKRLKELMWDSFACEKYSAESK